MQTNRFYLLSALILVSFNPCCSQQAQEWLLPVKLGDSKTTVLSVLGKPKIKTSWDSLLAIDWFPDSGMAVWYDTLSMKLSQIMVYGTNSHSFRTYKGGIIGGLKVTDNIRSWKKVLGKPSSITKVEHHSNSNWYEWRMKSYILSINVWVRGFSDKNGYYPKGSISFLTLKNFVNVNDSR